MTLLTLCRAAARRIGVNVPDLVAAATDDTGRQLFEIAREEGADLAARHAWSALRAEHTFVTVAGTAAYDLPVDFGWLLPDTVWSRTAGRPLAGPETPARWQALQAAGMATGAPQRFMLRAGQIHLHPTPLAGGETVAFEYVSADWARAAADTAPQPTFTLDGDTSALDETLLTLGVVWRFLKAKGLDYGEAFASYERRVAQTITRDGGRRTTSLAARPGAPGRPRIPDTGIGL